MKKTTEFCFFVNILAAVTTPVASWFTVLPVSPLPSSFLRSSTTSIGDCPTPFIHVVKASTMRLFVSSLTDGEETGVTSHGGQEQGQGQDVSTSAAAKNKNITPGEYENSKFSCDETVLYWQNFQRSGLLSAAENLREIIAVSNRFAAKGGGALNYWLRHNARSGYFLTNAILGVTASNLHERLIVRSSNNSGGNDDAPTFTNSLVRSNVITRLILETALTYEQDYCRIERGNYKLPYDMYTPSQQTSPLYALGQTNRFVREAVGTLTRRNRGYEEDKTTWISADATSDLYPEYYRNAFHYQTDGWMSSDSAAVYDTSTETLFLGRQDAMQRMTLVPLMEHCKEVSSNHSSGEMSSNNRPMKVLEVACGTGRFMTFARDNLPLDAKYTALDLSPFYLDKAREYDAQWRSLRQRVERESSDVNSNKKNGTTISIPPAAIVQGKAEDLPFGDNEFDAVVCIYLFHELPRDVRARAASEMARVTKPGGRVILTDSYQIGDRPIFDKQIGNFEKMNEPYYGDYIEDFLPDHFERAGMECLTKTVCSASKTISFRKMKTQD